MLGGNRGKVSVQLSDGIQETGVLLEVNPFVFIVASL